MKQAQADADELIAAYRREQQDAFDKNVMMKGEFLVPCLHVPTVVIQPSFCANRRLWRKCLGQAPSRNQQRYSDDAGTIPIKCTKGC
jgi:hypothetical protein